MTIVLGKVCTACGKERRNLLFHPETFEPFCNSAYICNDDHPNSIKNVVGRGSEIELIASEDAEDAYKEHLSKDFDPKAVQKIKRLLSHPSAIRFTSPDMAKFLVDFERVNGLGSISEAVRQCVQIVMDNQGKFAIDYHEETKEAQKQQQLESVAKEIESEPVSDSDDFGTF